MRPVLLATLVAFLAVACGGRSSVAQPPASDPSSPAVTQIRIHVADPDAGPLTFDAIAAGNPADARGGRLVLLLHGFPETKESFRGILPKLAVAGYYAVAPNQRGYSPDARPNDVPAYAAANLAGDVLGMATQLGADRFHVVGHDWGGGVAWAMALLGAPRVITMTSLSTPHPDALTDAFDSPEGAQARESGYMLAFRRPGYESTVLSQGLAAFVRRFAESDLSDAQVNDYVSVLGDERALKAGLDWYRANPLPLAARVGTVHVPVLFIWGARDPFFNRIGAEATGKYVAGEYRFERSTAPATRFRSCGPIA